MQSSTWQGKQGISNDVRKSLYMFSTFSEDKEMKGKGEGAKGEVNVGFLSSSSSRSQHLFWVPQTTLLASCAPNISPPFVVERYYHHFCGLFAVSFLSF